MIGRSFPKDGDAVWRCAVEAHRGGSRTESGHSPHSTASRAPLPPRPPAPRAARGVSPAHAMMTRAARSPRGHAAGGSGLPHRKLPHRVRPLRHALSHRLRHVGFELRPHLRRVVRHLLLHSRVRDRHAAALRCGPRAGGQRRKLVEGERDRGCVRTREEGGCAVMLVVASTVGGTPRGASLHTS